MTLEEARDIWSYACRYGMGHYTDAEVWEARDICDADDAIVGSVR